MSVQLNPGTAYDPATAFAPPSRPGAVMTPFGWAYPDAGETEKPSNLLQAFSGAGQAAPAASKGEPPRAAAATGEIVSPADPAQNIPLMNALESAPDCVAQALLLIQDKLNAANVDTSGMEITGAENLVWSPFGNFYDRQIVVKFADGQWVRLSADLTLKNPAHCIWPIQQVLGIPF